MFLATASKHNLILKNCNIENLINKNGFTAPAQQNDADPIESLIPAPIPPINLQYLQPGKKDKAKFGAFLLS
jgi:hypothetical protein